MDLSVRRPRHAGRYALTVLGPSTYYDDQADVATMTRAFHRVWELALSREASREFIANVGKELVP